MSNTFPITAYSITNALGAETRQVLQGLEAGVTGLTRPSLELPFETMCGALPADLPTLPAALQAYDSRQARVLAHLLDGIRGPLSAAVHRWGAGRVGVALGTSTAGIAETEKAYQEFLARGASPSSFTFERQHAPRAMLDLTQALTRFEGPSLVVSTACSSSAKVFGVARRWLKAGVCDAVLVGGVDTLCQITLRGFQSLQLLSKTPCRPFSVDRDGISIGEGGALLLLEREGSGPGQLLGIGETSEAHHMTAPQPDGLGAMATMEAALQQAGISPSEVDHINAHGTATALNDSAEGRAIARVFGAELPVTSTKGYTGHLLGAAGATEAVFSLFAIEHGWIPANIGGERPDPALGINVTRSRLRKRSRVVMSNSFAFGGSNACVVFGGPT
jgi:3-oxoacyl-[acyl-carrier-protein] synthase-1